MQDYIQILLDKSLMLAVPAAVFLLTVIFGYILRKILFFKLLGWSKRTESELDDVILGSIKHPFILWFIMLGIFFGVKAATVSDPVAQFLSRLLLVLGILSVTFTLANLSSGLIKLYARKFSTAVAVSSLSRNVARIIIFGLGILIILNSLGISVTPILATLGVGGLAVALALQDTLSNLFSGFHIIAARQVKIGDYIKIESGEEGYVTDISWRTTKIRMLPNNVVLVPNEKLAKAIITNFYLPDKEMAVLINIGVHYDSDLVKVEKVTCEVAKEVMKEVQGGVAGFDPFIRYHTFDAFSINFTVILRALEFVDQYLIKHEFIKRLHRRYAKEGIIIPYPIRAINYEQEKKS